MNQPQNLWISLDLNLFPTWLPIEVGLRIRMMQILVCRVWTRRNIAAFVVNFQCATNAGNAESLLRIVCLAWKKPSSKAHRTQHTLSDPFAVSDLKAPFSPFRSRRNVLYFEPACLLYMHESSLLMYLHIPSVFHNQRPCNGDRELYSGRNIDFTLKNHCPINQIFF